MPTVSPAWLTSLITLADFGGDGKAYIDHLYSIFNRDFVDSETQFRGKKVIFDNVIEDGKFRGFTHITTEENKATKERELCLRRCERLEWIKLMIENETDPGVLVWEQIHYTPKRVSVRTFIFIENEDFLIILNPIKGEQFLVTAIYVDYPNQKRKHLKAHKAYTERGLN